MQRKDVLINLLDKTFDKESWYAPFNHAIEGLTAEQADWKPEGKATKSIWENVNHLTYYKERLAAELEGREWKNNLDGEETFSLTDSSSHEWNAVVQRVEKAQANLRQAINGLPEQDFVESSLEEKLLDIMLHDAYHTGQIIQLRKMQGSWPENR
ncbi:DinB family protein [Bacillus salacetis]|uniref:DinB family protein n=1 Tax=Bacillus salacetis TaxID=2315464 RepID=A0A3A1R006_9BACI|nr:DinB family protein [Bacillus salacetis]RIW32045.1 DinB family protein [Bacillus salacetis]